jgi:hypothetical protein
MPQLDLKTVVFVGLAIEVVCNLVMAALWRQGRRQYAGLGFWALNFAAQTTGLFLILLRGRFPIWLSVSAANVLLVGGAWLGLLGLERFVGRRRRIRNNTRGLCREIQRPETKGRRIGAGPGATRPP